MKRVLIFSCWLACLALPLLARVHVYKGSHDVIFVKASLGKAVTLIFPEKGLLDLVAPEGWAAQEQDGPVGDVSLIYSSPNKIFLKVRAENASGRFNVVGKSNQTYTFDVIYLNDAMASDDTIEIKTYDELVAAKNGSGAMTVNRLMKTMIRGDDIEGVASSFYHEGDHLPLAEQIQGGVNIDSGIIYVDESVIYKVHRSYVTVNGLVGYVVHVINRTARSYELHIDQIKMKNLLAVSGGIMNKPTETIQPSGTVYRMRQGNRDVLFYGDTSVLYLIFGDR